MDEAYFVEQGRFVLLKEDGTSTDVPAEVGASHVIADSINMPFLVVTADGKASENGWGVTTSTVGIAEAESAAYTEIAGRSGLTDAEKYEHMHRAFGDSPTAVAVGVDVLGPAEATKIWGSDAVALAGANSLDQKDDGAPSGVIHDSQTQGSGPVPQPGVSAPGTSAPSNTGVSAGAIQRSSAGTAEDSHAQGTTSSPRADPRTGGDPLILASGQLYVQVTDLRVQGRGIHFAFTRTYMHQTHYRGPMGYSWDHNYNLWLREAQEIQLDGSTVNVVYRSTGEVREDRYEQVAGSGGSPAGPAGTSTDAIFRAPVGFFDELSRVDGIYRLRMVNGTAITYNTDLFVETIADPSGNTLKFAYTDGRLTRVVDAVGKIFDFSTDEHGRIVAVDDRTGGRRLAYAYDDIGNLIECDIFADSQTATTTDYVYLGANALPGLEHNLVEVIAGNGECVLAAEYGVDEPWQFNKVIAQRSLDGFYGYEYGPAEDLPDIDLAEYRNLPLAMTRVHYPNGHIVEHLFNAQGNVVQRREQVGPLGVGGATAQTLIASYEYNFDGLMTREQHPDGAVISYEYEVDRYEELNGRGTAAYAPSNQRLGHGNLHRRRETPRAGTGEVRQLVTSWSFLPGGALVEQQRGPYYADLAGVELPGQATPEVSYSYDQVGRLIEINCGPVETADGGTQTLAANRFTYDQFGNLVDVRIGVLRTHYDYFPDSRRSGFICRRIEDADGLARETVYETDDLGRLVTSRNSLGAEYQWTYNGFDLVVTATFPPISGASPTTSYRYDRVRRVVQETKTHFTADGTPHPDGALVISYRYDSNGRLIETLAGAADGTGQRQTRSVYEPWGQVRRTIDPAGAVTEAAYDSRNLLKRIRYAVGTAAQVEHRFAYNRSAELSGTVDANGHTTVIERDGFGRINRLTDRDGVVSESGHDAQDRQVWLTVLGPDPAGGPAIPWSQRRRAYDAAGRLMRSTEVLLVPGDASVVPREIVTSYLYDAYSRLVRVDAGALGTVRMEYDGLGRVIRTQDADGNETSTTFDDIAQRFTVVVAERDLGSTPPHSEYMRTQVQHDDQGLIIETTDPLGNRTLHDYDSRGLEERLTLPDGRIVQNTYDVHGQLLQQQLHARGGIETATATYEYDAVGQLRALTTPSGNRSEWTFDARGLLIRSEGPDGLRTTQYDAEGRPIASNLPSGVRTHSSYSPEGLLLRLEVDGSMYLAPVGAPGYTPLPATTTTFAYTPTRQLIRATSGDSLDFVRDSLGRVLQESSGHGTLKYQWDDAGRRTAVVYPDGRHIRYAFSPGGALTEIRQLEPGAACVGAPGAGQIRQLVAFDRVGRRIRRMQAPGILDGEFHYDPGARLISIEYGLNGVPLETLGVLRNSAGKRLLEWRNAEIRTLAHDGLGRLSGVKDFAQGASPPIDPLMFGPAQNTAQMDLVTQQTELTAAASTAIAAAGGELRSFTYQLDLAGNRLQTLTADTGAAPTITTYSSAPGDRYDIVAGQQIIYDRDGNLISDGSRSFRYDMLGRLREMSEGPTTLQATYDPLSRLADLTSGGITSPCLWAESELVEFGAGALRAQLVPGGAGNSPAHIAAGGQDLVPLVDDSGTVTGWAGTNGTSPGVHLYDPFGRSLVTTGSDPAPLGFAGHLVIPGTDLHWLYARIYDARLGRFLQPDPLGFADGPNQYAYARNAPGTLIDRYGFSSSEIDWGTVAAQGVTTAAVGIGIAAGAGALVGAGVVSAPVIAAIGGAILVGSAIYSYSKRSDEALAAGQTDRTGRAALLAMGDTIGASGIYEGITGQDGVTDRALGTTERSERLGSGIGSLAAAATGPKAFKLGGKLGGGVPSLPAKPGLSVPTEADMLAPLNAEDLGGTRIWLVGPEGAPTTRAIRIRGNLVTYDTQAPATGSGVKQDMGAIANQFGGKGLPSNPPGDWATGTHGTPTGEFLGPHAEPKFFYSERGYGQFQGWRVHNVGAGPLPPTGARPLVLNWCYSSSVRLPPVDPVPLLGP